MKVSVFILVISDYFLFLGISNDKFLANEDKFKQMHLLRCKLDNFEDQIHTQDQIECRLKEAPEEAIRKERRQVYIKKKYFQNLVCYSMSKKMTKILQLTDW